MSVKPVVRYMILSDDWYRDPQHQHRVTIVGLVNNIVALDDPPFPIRHESLSVFVVLSEVRGPADAKVVCVLDETQEAIFESSIHRLPSAASPLDAVGVGFRLRDCKFYESGIYTMQLWWNAELLEERSFQVR